MKSTYQVAPHSPTSKKSPKANLTDAEFRRRLKNISEWRKSALPNLTPRIRVEGYIPIRYVRSYDDSLTWVIEEFTHLRGGCTVNEDVGGYYLSHANKVINDRISIVYSDFPMNWDRQADRTDVLTYCAMLKDFLFANLWEEEILICAYPVSPLRE